MGTVTRIGLHGRTLTSYLDITMSGNILDLDPLNQHKPGRGRLLVSEPYLPDPYFERTVVLLCEHNEEGSFGFVLNKPSILKLPEVMEDLTAFDNVVYV